MLLKLKYIYNKFEKEKRKKKLQSRLGNMNETSQE